MSENYDDIIEKLSDDEVEEIPPAPIPGGMDYDGDVEEVKAEVVRDKNSDDQPVDDGYNKMPVSEYSVANPLSLISVICGVVSVVCCFSGAWNLIFALTAIITGVVSMVMGRDNKNSGLAVAGIIAGALGVGLSIVAMIFNGIGALISALWH